MTFRSDREYAEDLDKGDPLSRFQDRFHFPAGPDGNPKIYLSGNSLGLQPKAVRAAIDQELEDWAQMGVRGHLGARLPWVPYHEFLASSAERLVNAKPGEVVFMNSLSVNLHLMMVSFFNPEGKRNKILIEGGAFPSDRYAVVSQLRFHGLDPTSSLREIFPRKGEETIRLGDIAKCIEDEGETIALILFSGVQYYTGQAFDMERITRWGHDKGCRVGFDLAHAIGNIPIRLHEWEVDFAAWCSYKYLNGGPGSIGGCFVHEVHGQRPDLKRFAGWWGHNKANRFSMPTDFEPIAGAEGWQLSNPPIFQLAALRASLQIFDEVGIDALREKSLRLTGYLEFLLQQHLSDKVHVITPSEPRERGCQLSLKIKGMGKDIFTALERKGVFCDWREPEVIRVAPVPLYNRFSDVYRFVEILRGVLQ